MKPKAWLKSLNTNFLLMASRPATSPQPPSLRNASALACPVSFCAMLDPRFRFPTVIVTPNATSAIRTGHFRPPDGVNRPADTAPPARLPPLHPPHIHPPHH